MTQSRVVAQNILLRAKYLSGEGSERGKNLRTGLLLEGGARAGAHGGGAILALEDRELSEDWDGMVGVSAGAFNAGYLQARESERGQPIYFEVMGSSNFLNPLRFWKIADMDFLESSMRTSHRLNLNRITSNRCPFYVAVTDLDGHGGLLTAKSSDYDPLDAMVTSGALPFYFHRPRMFAGKLRMDGGISMPLPVRETAELFGLTDLLVILNVPNEPMKDPLPLVHRLAAHALLRPISKGIEQAFLNRARAFNNSLSLANAGVLENGCRVAVIGASYEIPSTCNDTTVIQAYYREGYVAVEKFFEGAE